MKLAFLLIVILYGGANFYIFHRLYSFFDLCFPGINKIAVASVYVIVAVTLLLAFMPIGGRIKYFINWLGMHWMGLCVYLFMFLLLADLALLIVRIFTTAPLSRDVRFFSGLIALILAFGFTSYGLYNATKLSTVCYKVQLDGTEGQIRVVMISDLHIGAVNSEKRLPHIVEEINAQNPDIVCIVGDLFDGDYNAINDPHRVAELLRQIQSKYGVYACLGNHDGGETFDQMLSLAERCGISVLKDNYTVIDDRFVLVGRLDASPIGGYGDLKRGTLSEILSPIEKSELPIIVMEHNPTHIDEYGDDVSLILSGHTHKGQIVPGNLVTNAMYTVDYGYYRCEDDGFQAIVSCGAGTWGLPMRVGSTCEIVCIDISA